MCLVDDILSDVLLGVAVVWVFSGFIVVAAVVDVIPVVTCVIPLVILLAVPAFLPIASSAGVVTILVLLGFSLLPVRSGCLCVLYHCYCFYILFSYCFFELLLDMVAAALQ